MVMTSSCPLCNRLQKLPGDEVVWQFPHSVAYLGPWQYYTGYCVLVSRTHATELHLLPPSERLAYLGEMATLGNAIAQSFQPRKMNCELLGNQVPHLHWHLFPRSADDPETLKAVWLALDRADQDEHEKQRLQQASLDRSQIIQRIQSSLQTLNAPTA